MTEPTPARAVAQERARAGYGRLLALLSSMTHDIPTAEDALADAFEAALRTWPERGIPDNPDGWLLTVARNRLRDRWKSAEANRTETLDPHSSALPAVIDLIDPDAIPDRRLELMLVCAHPAIAESARTPLMLNTVLGFTAAQIARAYAVPPATMSTRLTRAKAKIAAARIPFRLPDVSVLPDRLSGLLDAVYAAYTIEWSAGPGHLGLLPEGVQLAEILATLLPAEPEVRGLAALVLLSAARSGARLDEDERFVPLGAQDPGSWDRQLIERGRAHLAAAHAHGRVGRFQLEAAIQAVHCARIDGLEPDPEVLLGLYQALAASAPTLGVVTALAGITARVQGPASGLSVLGTIEGSAEHYQPAWVTRAHLLQATGRTGAAKEALARAVELTGDRAQRDHLESLAAQWAHGTVAPGK